MPIRSSRRKNMSSNSRPFVAVTSSVCGRRSFGARGTQIIGRAAGEKWATVVDAWQQHNAGTGTYVDDDVEGTWDIARESGRDVLKAIYAASGWFYCETLDCWITKIWLVQFWKRGLPLDYFWRFERCGRSGHGYHRWCEVEG